MMTTEWAERDQDLSPELRQRYGTYRNVPWVRRRIAQVADVLRLPFDAVWIWDEDWQRRAIAEAEWERWKYRHHLYRDVKACRAITLCSRYGLAVAEVQGASDQALLALDGMGPKGLAALRRVFSRAVPPPVLPEWIDEE